MTPIRQWLDNGDPPHRADSTTRTAPVTPSAKERGPSDAHVGHIGPQGLCDTGPTAPAPALHTHTPQKEKPPAGGLFGTTQPLIRQAAIFSFALRVLAKRT